MDLLKKLSAKTIDEISENVEFDKNYETALNILKNAKNKWKYDFVGDSIFEYFKESEFSKGILRCCPINSFVEGNLEWEEVLDFDRLSFDEGMDWNYKGANYLSPSFDRVLLFLTKDGKSDHFIREFDLKSKSFVKGGFVLPEGKSSVFWVDRNHIAFSAEFGEKSLSTDGFPLEYRLLKRNSEIADAERIFRAPESYIGVFGFTEQSSQGRYHLILAQPSYFEMETYLYDAGGIKKLSIPRKIEECGIFRDNIILILNEDWQTEEFHFSTGDVVAVDILSAVHKKIPSTTLVFEQKENHKVQSVAVLNDRIYIRSKIDIYSKISEITRSHGRTNEQWEIKDVELPSDGILNFSSHSRFGDRIVFSYENSITPKTLFYREGDGAIQLLKARELDFDIGGLEIQQCEATSADGNKVPYIQISQKGIDYNSKNPCIIQGVGGFSPSIMPYYNGIDGKLWLEKGGVLILANIRGFVENNSNWQKKASYEKRENFFNDFFAVAEHIIAKKLTSPNHLGVSSRSSGGLLIGLGVNQRPDLYRAAVCRLNLLDLDKYHKLILGKNKLNPLDNILAYDDNSLEDETGDIIVEGSEYTDIFFVANLVDSKNEKSNFEKLAHRISKRGDKLVYFENSNKKKKTLELHAKAKALEYTYFFERLF